MCGNILLYIKYFLNHKCRENVSLITVMGYIGFIGRRYLQEVNERQGECGGLS
jgi:hypothetical protein